MRSCASLISFFNLMSYQLSYLKFVLLIRKKIRQDLRIKFHLFNVKFIYLDT